MTHPKADGLDALKREAAEFAVEYWTSKPDIYGHGYKNVQDLAEKWTDHLAQRGMLVPDGWVAVPKDPTCLMRIAGQQKINQTFNTAKDLMKEAGEIYSHMLTAAPKMEGKE